MIEQRLCRTFKRHVGATRQAFCLAKAGRCVSPGCAAFARESSRTWLRRARGAWRAELSALKGCHRARQAIDAAGCTSKRLVLAGWAKIADLGTSGRLVRSS